MPLQTGDASAAAAEGGGDGGAGDGAARRKRGAAPGEEDPGQRDEEVVVVGELSRGAGEETAAAAAGGASGKDGVRADLRPDAGLALDGVLPKMVILDLDHTVWPTTLLVRKRPPFTAIPGRTGACKCVDADGDEDELVIYPGVMTMLNVLQQRGVRLAIASSSPSIQRAEEALRALGLFGAFKADSICVFAGNKEPHLRRLLIRNRGVAPGDALFFDDLEPNIQTARRLGIAAHRVDRKEGFGPRAWRAALRVWRSTRSESRSFRAFFKPVKGKQKRADDLAATHTRKEEQRKRQRRGER